MTLAYLRLLGQAGPAYPDPASQRETLMLLVLLAAIGMVCLLAAAMKTRKLKTVMVVGGGILAVLIVVSVLANLSMLVVRPRPVVNLTGSEQHAIPVPAAEAESFRTSVSSRVMMESGGQTSDAAAEARPLRQQLFSDLVDTWQADVYPSEKSAVRALLARIDKQIDGMTADPKEPAEIQVQGKVRHELLVQVVDALKKTHPESRITLAQTTDDSVMPPADKQTVVVHLLNGQGAKGIASYVRVQAVGWERSMTEQANVVDKPWADDFAVFASQNGTRKYLVVTSQRPATSAEESEQDALRLAAEALLPRVLGQMAWPPAAAPGQAPEEAQRWLKGQLTTYLQRPWMTADRFVQRLQAPYGEVWQTSLLIDVSPGSSNIAQMVREFHSLRMVQDRGAKRTALSVVGVIALVCLVYAWLNVATKGYFVWSLRAAAVAMVVGGVFLVLLCRMGSGRVTVQTNTEPQGYREEPTVLRRTDDRGQQTLHYYTEH